MKKEDISVEIENDYLHISGERSHEHEEKDKSYYRKEISKGRFERTIRLPEGVNTEEAESEYSDGVLQISIPKSETSNGRIKIDVK